ncbi:MAG: tetratricopeptide repeat protein [Candidatus Acidiferrales bacterium]
MSTPPNAAAIESAGPHRFSREVILLACLGLLLIFFASTAFLTRMYHHQVHTLGDEWFAKGEASFQAHDIEAALTDYRNALVYSPNSTNFQFHLAQALAAAGRGDEARAYLLNLLSESPGDGQINLELARIAARQGAMPEALRYYHAAVYGVWDSDPIAMRWRLRRELCEYLLDHGAANQAVAELILLAENTPPDDTEELKIVGNLLLRAQLWPRALSAFHSVLAAEPRDAEAMRGAGTAAFQLGQYLQAVEYFDRLPHDQAADSQVTQMIETSREILDGDPFRPGIPDDVRAQRAATALATAESRVQECASGRGISLTDSPPKSDLQTAYAMSQQKKTNWSEHSLRRFPDRVDEAMSIAFRLEDLATQTCGAPQGKDNALWLLGRSRGVIP